MPSAAAAINAMAPRPANLAIAARLTADLSYETHPDSAKMTLGQQIVQEEALAGAGKMGAAALLPKLRPIAPSTWSIGVPSCVPDEK